MRTKTEDPPSASVRIRASDTNAASHHHLWHQHGCCESTLIHVCSFLSLNFHVEKV